MKDHFLSLRFFFCFIFSSLSIFSLCGITLSFKSLHPLHVHLIFYFFIFLDEWAGDIQVNGQLVKTTVIGNVNTEMKKQCMSFPKTDRKEIGSLGKLGRR